jgi:hypothetical protein
MRKGHLGWGVFFLLWWLGGLSLVVAQGRRTSVRYIAATAYWGSIEIHSRKIEYLRGTNPYGVDVDWSWRFLSEKSYRLCQCYPSLGMTLNYRDFGHASLGHAFSSLFYVEPEVAQTLRVNLYLRAGMGISYLSHPFDARSNPSNLSYSTHFSFPLMIGLVGRFPLSEAWALNISGTFQHLSNGGTSQPNLGINYGALGVGVQKKLDAQPLPPPFPLTPFDPKTGMRGLHAGLMMGLKEPDDDQSAHFVLGVFGEYLRQFGRINAWNIGALAELDNSRETTLLFDRSRYSTTIGHRFLLGRFSFGQMAGFYIWSGHPTKAPWYQYYTIDFKALPEMSVGVGLKAHGKVAEFLGTRLSLVLF